MDKIIRILHVEDSLIDSELICDALKKGNVDFELKRIATKDEYVAALDQFLPNIILSNHSLPTFDFLEALAIVLNKKRNIPFILVTANSSLQFAVDCMKKGADDYILKDNLQGLPDAVLHALTKHRLEDESQAIIDELLRNEKRFRSLVYNGADGMTILSKDGLPMYVAPSKDSVLGYSDEEVMSSNLFRLIHPDDIPMLMGLLCQVNDHPGMAIKTDGIRMLHSKGNWIWIEGSLTNMLQDSDLNGIVVNFRDITDRKLAEEQVLNNEHRFRRLIENSPGGISILSATGEVVYISPSIKNVAGYTAEEASRMNLSKLSHPDDIHLMAAVMAQVMANPGKSILGPTMRMKHKDGTIKWVDAVLMNLLDDPAIKGIVNNFWDVTERIQAEQLIKESEEKYRMFFENSMDGILLTYTNGGIFAANPAACSIFQMTEVEICKAGILGLVDSSDPRVLLGIEDPQLNGKIKVEITMVRNDGSKFPGELSSAIYMDSMENERTSMIIRDITERELAHSRLIELNHDLQTYTKELVISNKELEQFSYILSHNLRAPVANIMGITEELMDPLNSEATKKLLKTDLSTCINLLNDVLIDMNAILKVKKDISEKKKRVKLSDLIADIQTSIQSLINAEKVQIRVDFKDLNEVLTLKSYIYSIFFNLISNSIKYRQPGIPPIINIKSEVTDQQVILTYSDNGMGFDLNKYKNQIFGLYKRFHQQIEGKGMGLFMVKTQVETLNGKITVSSEINKGTEFIMTFPRDQ